MRKTNVRTLRTAIAALTLSSGVLAAEAESQAVGRVEGRVVDARTQRALDLVTVFIDGRGIGTTTSAEGNFVLPNVPAGTYRVQARRIGYITTSRPVTIVAGETARADFTLSESAVTLDQVVVTGTAAEVRAKEVGHSLDAVGALEIRNVPVANPQDILAGRVPSVTIMSNSGQPGAGGTIKVRGTNTVSQEAEPLIYVDGIRIFNEPTRNNWGARTASSPLQDIPAEDIERIEVVKGASATTLYGTEAAGGVIQIFTKKGFAGAPIWNAELQTGVNVMGHWGDPDDPSNLFVSCGKTDLMYGLKTTRASSRDPRPRGTRIPFVDPTCPASGKWTQAGAMEQFNLSVRGGAERMTYFLSGNYGNIDGVLPTQNSKDGGFRGNFGFKPLEELEFQLTTAYFRRNTRWVGDGNNAEGFLLNVGRGHANYLKGGKGDDCAQVPADVVCVTNRYVFEQDLYTRSDHYITGFTTLWNPTDKLSNRFALGWDYTDIGNETTLPFGFLTLNEGYFWDETTRHTKLSLDYAGSLQSSFGEAFGSTLSWGGQLFRDRHRWTELDVQGFAGPGEPTLESGAEITYRRDRPFSETNAGFFLQEQLAWRDLLFVTAGVRVDGNSAFGDDFGLQSYPKAQVAYVVSDHSFWELPWWETLKLRAAVGESGKAPGAFDKLRTWTPVSGNEGEPGFTPGDIGNPDIGPERTREYEGGFDASLFSGRIGLEATAFYAKTFDALVGVTYPPSQGFLSSRTENVGELENRGLELQLTGDIIRTATLEWQARLNLSRLSSKTLDLDGGKPDTTTINTGLKSEIREGYPVPMYFGDRIMNPNAFAEPVIVQDTALGLVYPNRLYGFGTTITFRNDLTLDALIEHQGGHSIANFTAYQNARRGVYHPCYGVQDKLIAAENGDASALSDVTALQRVRCSFDDHDSDYWVEDASFTKLRHVSLTYELPKRFIGGSRSAAVTLAGRNLLTWTNYTGSDPEVQDAADQFNLVGSAGSFGRRDYYQLPSPRTYMVTLRVGF